MTPRPAAAGWWMLRTNAVSSRRRNAQGHDATRSRLRPVHDHGGRPGTLYVLQGTITGDRNGMDTEYGPGVGWPEDHHTSHWLENRGTVPGVESSVDIVATSRQSGRITWCESDCMPSESVPGRGGR